MRMSFHLLGIAVMIVGVAPAAVRAAENELTAEERAAGWRLLFNGRDATGWITSNRTQPPDSVVEDGTLTPFRSGGYLLVREEQYGDFILRCEVKMSSRSNSGIFLRVGDLANPVQTGIEVQIYDSTGTGVHDFGALYDLVPPSKNNLKPLGEWNALTVTCRGPHISVAVNGETVAEMNCDEWTEPGRRPDGSRHKFRNAIRDFPRRGYLGFQDHSRQVWFRNIEILELDHPEESDD